MAVRPPQPTPAGVRRYYITYYWLEDHNKPEGAKYTTYLLADDDVDAQHLATLRGLGEVIVDKSQSLKRRQSLPVPIMRPLTRQLDRLSRARSRAPRYTNLLTHSVHHCAHIAQASGRWQVPTDAFSDHGLFHQLVHMHDPGLLASLAQDTYAYPKLHNELAALEAALPEMFRREVEFKRHL